MYEARFHNLTKELNKYKKRVEEDQKRDEYLEKVNKQVDKMKTRAGEWKDDKPWITANETEDVNQKIADFEKWLGEQIEKQSKLAKYQDPVLSTTEATKKLKTVKKFFDKINAKRAPPPPKPPKNETEEFDDGEDQPSGEGQNQTEGNTTHSEEPSSQEEKQESQQET